MFEKALKFQVPKKGDKMKYVQPLLPTINFNNSEKYNDSTIIADYQSIGNRHYHYNSQKRNQIKSIRRSSRIGYTQMIDNYKNTSRQSQENPFSEEFLIKPFQNNRNKEQLTERQPIMTMDYQLHKYNTIEGTTKSIRYKSQTQKVEQIETNMKISPYIHQNKRFQCIDYFYII
ncbi:unnamed protein product (macronuclear) [Paramecium tetraurelia]|uniref:Uncharacterized protein n=1 Tax=Paramecium tetraurelia TaxID=5888 RepID=A0BVG1_PARTE|nr:uncharacterized protein GSPATT00005774001 [Paramecium tetraurelia]CAK62528.1 unnamed protein product [Paramecium tetraurelia]|eukprot:XP_001429926.1 hypothetical protein (macronuclear) [Paramecium tetraurelia strain d4-2]